MPGESKTFTYVIDAETDDFKSDIDGAASSLSGLQDEADAATPALTGLQKAQKLLAEQTAKLNEALKSEAAAARAAAAAEREATKALRAEEKAARDLANTLDKEATKAARAHAKAIKEEEKRAKALARTLEKETAAAERELAQETKRATAATKAAASADNKRAGELKQGLNAVLGDQVNKVADVGTAFGTTGLAIVGSAAAGVAAVAALAAITVVTLNGIVSLGQGVVDLTREMDGYSVEVSEANDAMDATSAIASVLKGELATELAPTVEEVARVIGALGLVAIDGFEAVADGSDLAFEGINRLASFASGPGTEAWLTFSEAQIALLRLMGVDVPEAADETIAALRLQNSAVGAIVEQYGSLESQLGSYLEEVDEIAASQRAATESSKAQAEAEAELAAKRKSHARDVAAAQQKAAAEAARAADEAAKKQAALFKQQIAAEDELRAIASERAQQQLSDLEKLEQARDDEINQINTLLFLAGNTAEAEEQATTARLAVLEEFSQARFNLAVEDAAALKAINDKFEDERVAKAAAADAQRKAGAESLRNDLISAAQQASTAIIAGFSEQNRQFLEQQDQQLDKNIAILEMKKSLTDTEQKALDGLREKKAKLAKFDFLREKAAALATIAVNTAVAIVNAAASLPPPANVPFIVGAAALGAVQLGIVAGTSPPKAHDGEALISSFNTPAIQSGEVDRRVLEGESVLNQRASNSLGRGGVDALNTGGGVGGGRDVIMLDGEELARSTVRRMRGDGPLGIIMRGSTPGIGDTFGGR